MARTSRPKLDEFAYIRSYYGVNPGRGMRVTAYGKPGTITGVSGPHLMIRIDGAKFSTPHHPTEEIDYQPEPPAES